MRDTLLATVLASLAILPNPGLAQDASVWAGFNVGLHASIADGFQDYGGSTTYSIEGEGFGLFAGYMIASGAWAYGAELGYANTRYYEVSNSDGAEFSDYRFSDLLELKLRLGYAVNRTLVYGVVGYNWSTWEEGSPDDTYDAEGSVFGLGVDHLLSDRTFLGAELVRRGLDGDYPFEAHATTLAVRLGMTF
jgi:hypothetical protein